MQTVQNCALIAVFGMLAGGLTAKARALPTNPCSGNDIRRFDLAINSSDSFTIKYEYEIVRTASRDYPTVLYIPGGPGAGSIGDNSISQLIPDEFGLILTDPRGVGCNASRKFKSSDFSTSRSAADLLSILKNEKLDPANVILYGKSYGTELATTTADLNLRQGHPPFRLVVLEGVLGRSMNVPRSSWDGYLSASADYFSERPGLGEKVESAILSHKVDRKSFAKFLAAYLLEGSSGKETHPLDQPLQFMTDGMNFNVFDQTFLAPFKSANSDLNDVNVRVWTAIACSELGFSDLALTFENGALVVSKDLNPSKLTCAEKQLSRPYDSTVMQLREPLIYLEGSEDPAAPPTPQAKYHFNNQHLSPKKAYFLFDGFGHSILNWLDGKKAGLSRQLWLSEFDSAAVKSLLANWRIDVEEKSTGD